MTETVYEAVGGLPALESLAHAWHERCLADPVVAHAFSHGHHPDHSHRLALYWAEALGGPRDYTATIATESAVVRMHARNGEHHEMDERAVGCFAAAVDDVGLAADPALAAVLVAYFRWATERLGIHHDSASDVPDGLDVPRWSWDGLVDGGIADGAPPTDPQPQ